MTHIERVACAYLDAPRRSDLPATAAAYAQLTDQCGRWYDHLTSRARQPVRVVFTRCRAPCATGAEVAAAVRYDRVLELCPTRGDPDRRHPLLETSVGGAYDRMRAVHEHAEHKAVLLAPALRVSRGCVDYVPRPGSAAFPGQR
jgi:hypothetical protein